MSELIERLKTIRHFNELNDSEKEELKNSSAGFVQVPKDFMEKVSGGDVNAVYIFDCSCGGKVFDFYINDDDDPVHIEGWTIMCINCGKIYLKSGIYVPLP